MIGKPQLDRPGTKGSAHSTKPAPVKSDVAPVQSSFTMPPTSDVEMTLRMALPQGVHGADTILLIIDPRLLIPQAVLVRNPQGRCRWTSGRGSNAEQQRQ